MPGAVSVEPEASTVQVSCAQLVVNAATGAWLAGGGPSSAAFSTTVHMVALPEPVGEAVAVRPVTGPADEGVPRSDATAVIRPPPVPRAMLRSS